MDVQGYELMVMDGARLALEEIWAVETEMSLWPTYSGQPSYTEIVAYLDRAGFDIWSLSPGHRDTQSGRMLEMDGIFVRRD
jgi:hypothetical protein